MITASLPPNTTQRLKTFDQHQVVDTNLKESLDDLTRLATYICQTPMAFISIMNTHRQWIPSAVGISVTQFPRMIDFSVHAILETNVFEISDTFNDSRYSDNPLVTADPYIRFYAGAPLQTSEGYALGTLCVIDQIPRTLSPDQQEAMAALSRQVSLQLALRQTFLRNQQSNHYFRAVIEAAPHAMIMINQDGTIVLTNQALEKQFGYGQGELLNQGVECLVPERYRTPQTTVGTHDFIPPQLKSCRRTRIGIRKDGLEFPFEITSNPLRIDEGRFVLASVIDITTQEREKTDTHQYIDDLQRSNQELEDFASIASHDLKEPLRGIFNYSTILLKDHGPSLNEDALSKCQTLLRLSHRMEHVIDSLHDFSRASKLGLAIGQTKLQDVLEEILDSLDIRLKECGVDIRIPRPLPIVHCDQVRVREILTNLMTNAMKYNDKNIKWIEIGYLEGNRRNDLTALNIPVFYVRDNGIGIPNRHLPNIFRIFKRLHARDKFGGGTGAGLTIAKKLVERHEGSLWVESTYGEGSTFFFTLERGMKDGNHFPGTNSIG